MFNWIKSLFASLDRGEAAADRIGAALEGIADDLERLRSQVRQRIGVTDDPPALPAPPPTAEDHAANGGGKRRKVTS